MAAYNGRYYYAPHRKMWGIWRWNVPVNGVITSSFIKDCATMNEARDEVYRLNGWTKKAEMV